MISRFQVFLFLSLFVFSSLSFANTSILVFLEDAPLRFIKVSIDGKIVGVSDKKGMIQTSLSPGPHRGYLISDDNAVLFTFDLPVNGEIEVTATYTRDVEVDPEVTLNVFDEGETAVGIIRYVRIAEGGLIAGPNNEINGLTLQGVGHGTLIDYVQVHANQDDGIEWFGGTANVKHAVLTNKIVNWYLKLM